MVNIDVLSLVIMLTNLLPDILIVVITVFQIWKFESYVPFLVARIATKTRNVHVHPYGINECFSYVSLYLSLPDFNSHLIDPYLF